MKWTADNDQLLFMKLIETHEISIKTERIRDAWPTDRGEVPTARAITERIAKIRSRHKKDSSNGSASASGSVSAPSTPTRKRKTDAETPRGKKGRKRATSLVKIEEDAPVVTLDDGPFELMGCSSSSWNTGSET